MGKSGFAQLAAELDLLTPQERREREAAIKKAQDSLERHNTRIKDKPLPMCDDMGNLRLYIENELTEETKQELLQEGGREMEQLFNTPFSFPYVLDGHERHALLQERIFGREESSQKQIVAVEKLPTALQKSLKTPERLPRAITELSKFMRKRLGVSTDQLGAHATSMQLEFMALESEIYLIASFGLLPTKNRFVRPIALDLVKPLYEANSVEILFFVANKERKDYFRQKLQGRPWAKSVKLLQWHKVKTFFRSHEAKNSLANSYDLFFADQELEHELYTLGSAFDSTYGRTTPILVNDEARVSEQIDAFVKGSKIYISRGMQPVTIHVGYAQWKPEEVQANVVRVVQQLGYFTEGGIDNLLRLYIGGEKTPSLPFYYNEKAYAKRFRECKQFAAEAQWLKKTGAATAEGSSLSGKKRAREEEDDSDSDSDMHTALDQIHDLQDLYAQAMSDDEAEDEQTAAAADSDSDTDAAPSKTFGNFFTVSKSKQSKETVSPVPVAAKKQEPAAKKAVPKSPAPASTPKGSNNSKKQKRA